MYNKKKQTNMEFTNEQNQNPERGIQDISLVERDVVTIREAVQRAKEEGLPVSEYSLRRWVKSREIPVRWIGKKALIFYPSLAAYLRFDNNTPKTPFNESNEPMNL